MSLALRRKENVCSAYAKAGVQVDYNAKCERLRNYKVTFPFYGGTLKDVNFNILQKSFGRE